MLAINIQMILRDIVEQECTLSQLVMMMMMMMMKIIMKTICEKKTWECTVRSDRFLQGPWGINRTGLDRIIHFIKTIIFHQTSFLFHKMISWDLCPEMMLKLEKKYFQILEGVILSSFLDLLKYRNRKSWCKVFNRLGLSRYHMAIDRICFYFLCTMATQILILRLFPWQLKALSRLPRLSSEQPLLNIPHLNPPVSFAVDYYYSLHFRFLKFRHNQSFSLPWCLHSRTARFSWTTSNPMYGPCTSYNLSHRCKFLKFLCHS